MALNSERCLCSAFWRIRLKALATKPRVCLTFFHCTLKLSLAQGHLVASGKLKPLKKRATFSPSYLKNSFELTASISSDWLTAGFPPKLFSAHSGPHTWIPLIFWILWSGCKRQRRPSIFSQSELRCSLQETCNNQFVVASLSQGLCRGNFWDLGSPLVGQNLMKNHWGKETVPMRTSLYVLR